MNERTPEGVKIVLTASAIEMSDFHLNPFVAFTGGFPEKIVPRDILKKYWYPPVPTNDNGSVKFAPYGLRKVESLLVKEFGEDNVVIVHPDNLQKFVGKRTKVIGISSMEPAGIGFVSRTYTSLVAPGRDPLTSAEFRRLLNHPSIKKYKPRIIIGGSGAWQIEKSDLKNRYQIDTIVIGECERVCIDLFKTAMSDRELPRVVRAESPDMAEVPLIIRPAIYGVTEITRGCGRGCQFCSPTARRRYSFPLEHILKEVRLNAKAGSRMITLATEDLFLYKCKKGFIPNRSAIVNLLKEISNIPEVEYIQPAHASFAPVVLDPTMVEEIGHILVEKGRWNLRGKRYCAIEMGIETGSTRLLEKYMRGKMLPYKPEDWHDIVVRGMEILNQNGIYPLCTLITGLPGEREEDTIATLDLVHKLKGMKLFYVPLLFTSEEECMLREEEHAYLKDLTPLQWEFLATCWRHNIDLFMKPKNKRRLILASMIAYLLYYRWKHGRKVLLPMLKISGLDNFFMGTRVKCNPGYCVSSYKTGVR
jgi:radical SAM superfamily enzyme YgiQ (UPF0313 family)